METRLPPPTPALFFFCALSGLGTGQEPGAAGSTAFIDVHVVPMDRETVLEHQTVVVTGDHIAAIGPFADVDVPAGAERIDGRGRYLMPGLADMHVHVWNEEHLDLFLANGVTTVRNMAGASLHLRWKAEVEAGERIAPTIYTTGPLIDGPGNTGPATTIVSSPEEAADEVVRQAEEGYQALKVYDRLSLDAYLAVVSVASELELPVYGHVPTDVGLEVALDSGQDSIEHLTGYFAAALAKGSPFDAAWLKLPEPEFLRIFAPVGRRIDSGELCFEDVVSTNAIESLAAATAKAGTWNVPTLALSKATWTMSPEEVRATVEGPTMRYLDPATERRWEAMTTEWAEMFAEHDVRGAWIRHACRIAVVRSLHDAGARILLGTDTPNPLLVPGFSIHDELSEFVECGLSPYEALAAGTIAAAEFLDGSEEWGSVQAGRRADLVLLDGNPLEDVGRAAKPAGVMVRGRWLPRSSLDDLLEAVAHRNEDGEAASKDGR